MTSLLATKAVAVAVLLSPLAAALFAPKLISNTLRQIIGTAFRIASSAAFLLLIVQLTVVILRSVFSVSFIWLQEATLYLFGLIFLLASSALLLSDGHVRVDILYTRLSERRKAIVDLAGLVLFVLPLAILIIWVSWSYVGSSWAQLEPSQEASGIPAVFLLKTMIPVFAALIAMAAEVRIIDLVSTLTSKSANSV